MTDNDVRRLEDKVDGVALALARLEGSLAPTLEKLGAKEDEQDDALKDHEVRLRALERFRFAVPSISFVALLIGVAEAAYYLTHI